MTSISSIFQNLVEIQKQDPSVAQAPLRKVRKQSSAKRELKPKTSVEERKAKLLQKNYEEYVEAALKESEKNPNLSFFRLSKLDIVLIAEEFGRFIQGRIEACNLESLEDKEYAKKMSYLERAQYLLSLYERGIMVSTNRREEILNIVSICNSNLYLNPYIKTVLMGVNCYENLIHNLELAYFGNYPGMQAVCDYLDLLMQYLDESDTNLISCGNIISYYLNICWEKVRFELDKGMLSKTLSDYHIHEYDFMLLSLIYRWDKMGEELNIKQLSYYLANEAQDRIRWRNWINDSYIKKSSRIIVLQDRHFGSERTMCIAEELQKRLELSEKAGKDYCEQQERTKHLLEDRRGLFSKVQSSQRLKDLILNQQEYQILESVIARLKDPEHFDLSRWALRTPSLSLSAPALNSCLILLYGAPGTGKTYSAGVIANELGRDLLKIEASLLRDKYYGESEKRVKDMFNGIRYANQDPKTAPIFLLNEADIILHKRTSIQHSSVASAENAIQNIFLEELENLPGILILTTNRMDDMDEALFRRFHFKLEFKLPDADTASKLWRLHLVKEIPGALEIDCEYLGQKYCLSGGLIRIIVQNACYHAMQRGKNAILTLDDVERYAGLEALGKQNLERKIGF